MIKYWMFSSENKKIKKSSEHIIKKKSVNNYAFFF